MGTLGTNGLNAMDNIELRLRCLSTGDGLQIFRRLNHCASAGDGVSTESAGAGEKRRRLKAGRRSVAQAPAGALQAMRAFLSRRLRN